MGNHFATIVDGTDNLRPLGVKFLWEGAQEIVFAEVQAASASPSVYSSIPTPRSRACRTTRARSRCPRRAIPFDLKTTMSSSLCRPEARR